MDHIGNIVCKVCLCEFINVKQNYNFSDQPFGSKGVNGTSASVQVPNCDYIPEVCSKCLEFGRIKDKIKTENHEIDIEESVVKICKSEEVEIKEEHEILPVTFADVDGVKTECEDFSLEDPLRIATTDTNYKEIASTQLQGDTKTPTEAKPFKCEVCGKQFSLRGNLNVHKLLHTREKLYKCNVCNESFDNAKELKRHQKIHIEENTYRCNLCCRKFDSSENLRSHQASHTGEFECDICQKQFARAYNLRCHKQTHMERKPLKCDVCFEEIRSAYRLKTHKLLMHNKD